MAFDNLSVTDKARVMGGVNNLVALSDLPDATLALIGQSFCLEASNETLLDAHYALRALLVRIESEYHKRGI